MSTPSDCCATVALPQGEPSDCSPDRIGARTPQLILGPFYPVQMAARVAAEVAAQIAASVTNQPQAAFAALATPAPARSDGPQALHISGRVLNRCGQAVAQALVELWQADELGCYRHPSAPLPAPDDASFVGYVAVHTGADGGYAFQSRRPGAYVDGGRQRAPHLHFQVTGAHDRLITQVFFPGDEANQRDHWYQVASRPHQLVATLVHETPALLQLHWDIVLSTG